METSPIVDVVIAVHTPTRPVSRAVKSVLQHNATPVRVSVVAHNTEPQTIRDALGVYGTDPRVRVLSLQDGVPSPAGPKNFGLASATAKYVSLLDSDDELEPGAIDAWLARIRGSDVLIATVLRGDGKPMPTPPVRPLRRGKLSATKDRLAYRVGIWGGLILRERLEQLRFTEGLRTGEDQCFAMNLWFSGMSVVYAQTAPGYRLHDDQEDRVTSEIPSIGEEFEYLREMLGSGQTWARTRQARTAVAVKLLRTHVMDAYVNRDQSWTLSDAQALALVIERIVRFAPESPGLLSVMDASMLQALRDPAVGQEALIRRSLVARSRRSLAALLPQHWWKVLHRQGPLRTTVAAALIARRPRNTAYTGG